MLVAKSQTCHVVNRLIILTMCVFQGRTIGEFSKDKFPGEFMDAWRSAVSSGKFEKASTITGIQNGLQIARRGTRTSEFHGFEWHKWHLVARELKMKRSWCLWDLTGTHYYGSLSCVFYFKVDISATMAYIMAPKEESEINIIKKACQGTMDLFSKFLKEQIMDIVDKDKVSGSGGQHGFSFHTHLQRTNSFASK